MSGVVPAHAPAPSPPAQVVDTTDPSSPGADATSVAATPPARARGVTKVQAHARRPSGKAHGDGAASPVVAIGVDEVPQLPDPNANAKGKHGTAATPAAEAGAKPADQPVAEKPAVPAEKPAAEKPKPAPTSKPDPADAPLPNFPIPGVD
jgi:hypothetical protein